MELLMQEKYGFVYVWFDKKRNMYYVGCHWGTENDGYICSSNRMRNAFRRRPKDFRRKIISRIYTNRSDLLEKEFEWLSLIKKEELGKRYYNLRNHKFMDWHSDPVKSISVKEKISKSLSGRKGWSPNEEQKRKISEALMGHTHSEETKKKISESKKGTPSWNKGTAKPKEIKPPLKGRKNPNMARPGVSNPFYGKFHTEETRKAISEHQKGMIWITNGEINTRIDSKNEIPDGFRKGRFLREDQKRKSKQ
jgi:hypothetical protein